MSHVSTLSTSWKVIGFWGDYSQKPRKIAISKTTARSLTSTKDSFSRYFIGSSRLQASTL
jgi:hypothetical protein